LCTPTECDAKTLICHCYGLSSVEECEVEGACVYPIYGVFTTFPNMIDRWGFIYTMIVTGKD
ncbi:MAG: hypothetical protein V2A73_12390, partial [Pseudomonadota bacterium]